jgi:fatty acid desaturase
MYTLRNKYWQDALNLFFLLGEWFLIFGLIYLNTIYPSLLLQISSVFIIGTRVHALGILMHEASHYNLFSSKAANEWLVKIFISVPTLVSLDGYRKTHQLHHQYSQTDKDPTYTRKFGNFLFEFPKKSHWTFARELLMILFGYGIVVVFKDLLRNRKNQKTSNSKNLFLMFFIYTVFFTFLFKMQYFSLFLKFWLLPVFTVLPLINYWRTITEHSALPNSTTDVRSVIYNPLLSWLLTPYNINLHTEHHNHQKVKWNHLKEVYNNEKASSNGHYTYGLINLWNEFIKFK